MLTLIGKTQKGKNVIARDGKDWQIVKSCDFVPCLGNKPGLLITPKGKKRLSRGSRWIETNGGNDFEVTP